MTTTKRTFNLTKILKIISNVLFYFIVVFLLAFSIITISGAKPNEAPNIFGRGFLAVKTDSMMGSNEDSFNPGALIFTKILTEEQQKQLKRGDIVTFYDSRIKALNTHRIVEDPIVHADGRIEIQTRGDKYDLEENREGKEIEAWNDPTLDSKEILAIYTGHVSGVGGVILWVQTEVGFAVTVVLPIFLMFLAQGVILIRNIYADKNKLALENFDKEKTELLENERARIRAEVLKELEEDRQKVNEGDKIDD